jgi:hypothetical protein
VTALAAGARSFGGGSFGGSRGRPGIPPEVRPDTTPFADRSPLDDVMDKARRDRDHGLAPWPAWLGLALVLAGAGVRHRHDLRTRTRRLIRATARLNE